MTQRSPAGCHDYEATATLTRQNAFLNGKSLHIWSVFVTNTIIFISIFVAKNWFFFAKLRCCIEEKT